MSSNDQNNNNFDEVIGSVDTLKRATTVNKLSDMLDCINDMKLYAGTIEKDIPDSFESISIERKNEMKITELQAEDFIHLAKQRVNDTRFILLNDLIKQNEKSTKSSLRHSTMSNPRKSSLDKQVKYMHRLIAVQPSALEAIYFEALLNPDQWEYNHRLLQASPMENLTIAERKRLNELLSKLDPVEGFN